MAKRVWKPDTPGELWDEVRLSRDQARDAGVYRQARTIADENRAPLYIDGEVASVAPPREGELRYAGGREHGTLYLVIPRSTVRDSRAYARALAYAQQAGAELWVSED